MGSKDIIVYSGFKYPHQKPPRGVISKELSTWRTVSHLRAEESVGDTAITLPLSCSRSERSWCGRLAVRDGVSALLLLANDGMQTGDSMLATLRYNTLRVTSSFLHWTDKQAFGRTDPATLKAPDNRWYSRCASRCGYTMPQKTTFIYHATPSM